MPQCNYYAGSPAYSAESPVFVVVRKVEKSDLMPDVRHNWSALSSFMPDVRHNCSAMSDLFAGVRHNFSNSAFLLGRPAYECPA